MNLDYNCYIKQIIKIQSKIRQYLSYHNNIYIKHKNKTILDNFTTYIIGYHMINKEPIKEAIWENINLSIIQSIFNITYNASGSHKSGIDLIYNNWKISNKTGKIEKNNIIKISSYRLSSITSSQSINTIENIKNEITKRNNSYNYYSLLLRKDCNNYIEYFWYIIPKDYYIYNHINTEIKPKYDKNNKQSGWKSKYFEIQFSMSSQLWFNFTFDDIQKYLITSIIVYKKNCNIISYNKIYNDNKNLIIT